MVSASDLNPFNYTIELQGTGIVEGPTSWTSDVPITYNIPDGLAVGDYTYIVNFTDDGDNFITDSMIFTVGDDPTITNAPSDFTVGTGYSGQSISCTASDLHPDTYTIELQGTGVVAGPTSWTSGVPITYSIPDGLGLGTHVYTVNFTDFSGNSITDSFTFTVEDTTASTDDPTDDPTDDSNGDDSNGVGAIISLITLAIAVSIVKAKRREHWKN